MATHYHLLTPQTGKRVASRYLVPAGAQAEGGMGPAPQARVHVHSRVLGSARQVLPLNCYLERGPSGGLLSAPAGS